MAEFPSELIAVPQPLIGFYGLDLNNATHKSIFDSFSNRVDRPNIQYKIIPFNYECPTKKPKRTSFEWYNPKHIMKRNWMLKYLHVLPSLIVVFVDIEWKDPQWSEKQLNCSTMMQQLRAKFQDRSTRFALVLLQKNSTFLGTDDLIATERSASLSNNCEISSKQIFVLPVNDQSLLNYTIRMESAFLEMSTSFYIQMLKNYRSHQTNSSHQTLKVRHQFKQGFICEMRTDLSTALKYYTQSYANLEDIRVIDTNCLEVKTIAGFINYKMCKLMFKLNLPRDSITQFKAHIDKYKSRMGFRELLFEHYNWMSQQFQYFADLFAEAVKNGLAALQTQHPGIYYLKSSEYLFKRRDTFNQIERLPTTPTEATSSQFSSLYSDFFGVRNITNKNMEPGTDQHMILIVQEMESKFNYSLAIINLLGQAMSQFKNYRCGRARKRCAVMMADEYFKSGEYQKALTLYSLMLTDYRQEKWFTIFTDILTKTVQTSILAASVNDFVTSSFEALSPSIKIGIVERKNILENLWKVFNNSPPTYQNQIAPEIKQNWDESLSSHRWPILVDIDEIGNLIECKSTFHKNRVMLNEKVIVKIILRSNTEVPLKIRNVAVCLLTSSESTHRYVAEMGTEFEIDTSARVEKTFNDFKANDFMLESGKCYKFQMEVNPRHFTENVEIGISAVELTMGTEKNFATLALKKSLNSSKIFQRYDIRTDYLEYVNVIKTCYLIPTFQLSSQSHHSQPMLVNEFYKISTTLTNNEASVLENVKIIISLPTNLINKVFLVVDGESRKTTKLNSRIELSVGKMRESSNTTVVFYLMSMVEGNIELKQSICYEAENKTVSDESSKVVASQVSSPTTETPKNVIADKEDQHDIVVEYLDKNKLRKRRDDILIVPCVEEFHFESKFYTLNRQPATSLFKDEDFIMRCTLKMTSPFNIEIIDSFFLADVNVDEISNQNHKFVGRKEKLCMEIENLIILRPKNISSDFITNSTLEKLLNDDASKIFDEISVDKLKKDNPVSDVVKEIEDDPFALKNKDQKLNFVKNGEISKTIINDILSVSDLINDKRQGFVNAKFNLVNEKSDCSSQSPRFGVYCIKWKKIDSNFINESKFFVKAVDVRQPLLNIYTSPVDRVFVREIFTYKVTLKNPHSSILNLKATFDSSCTDGFMFSGHRQLNISIFSHSSFELTFNLYPLKSDWQKLPELKLDLISHQDDGSPTNLEPITPKQSEINELLRRWLPKAIFVHPPTRKMA